MSQSGLRADRWAVACFVVLLCAYASTLPTTLTDADAGEFLVIAKAGGVPHPPGYPLFTLICQLLALNDRWLPLVTLVAGFSALCVAGAGAVLVRALRPLVGAPAASAAVLLALLSPAVWRQANAAEPFALNLLLAALLLAVGLRLLSAPLDEEPRSIRHGAACLGLLFGLGFANHHTLAVLIPLPLLLVLRWRVVPAVLKGAVVVAVVAFIVGSVPILSLLAADRFGPLVYGDWDSARLLRHLLRLDYGSLQLAGAFDAYGESFWHFVLLLPRHTGFVGPVLLVLGLVRARAWGPWVWAALLCTTLLGVPVFLSMMSIPPDVEPVVVARFFALPMLLLVPWFAAGASALLALDHRRTRVAALGLVVVLAVHASLSRRVSNRASEQVYQAHIQQMLSLQSEGGVFVSSSDLADYGLSYGQRVLGLAAEAPLIMFGLFRSQWYRARLARPLGAPVDVIEAGFVPLLSWLHQRVPLLVVDLPGPPRPRMFDRARPLGGMMVVFPRQEPLPSWLEVYDANARVLDDLSVVPSLARSTPLSGWEIRLLRQHRGLWSEVCLGLRREHHELEAAACAVRARVFDEAITRLGTMSW